MPPLLDKLTTFLPGQMNPHRASARFCLSRLFPPASGLLGTSLVSAGLRESGIHSCKDIVGKTVRVCKLWDFWTAESTIQMILRNLITKTGLHPNSDYDFSFRRLSCYH